MAIPGPDPFLADDYPMVDETLGIWKLLRGIGKGGMGEVYEAEYDFLHLLSLNYKPEERGLIKAELRGLDRAELARMAGELLGTNLSHDARFAIKICTARRGTAGYRRFLQEAQWAQELGSHPYIVTVHAVHGSQNDEELEGKTPLERGKYRDVAFMVMDMAIRGYDHTELEIDQAVHIVRCIASALDHAHLNGVVHRDLKPENILGEIEHPLLTDFGIAKEIDQSLGLTRTGQVIGTLDYMSPEQATDAKRVDKRSDVYSLGVVLYEMATKGSLPYYHISEREECLAAIRSERHEPRWPRYYASDFPRGLEYIILKAMAHKPSERYQSMNEFITDLDRFTRGDPIRWWTRLHPRRWLSYWRQEHPRLIWAVPTSALVLVLILLGMWAPRWFDRTYTRIQAGTELLDALVVDIEDGRRQQLDGKHSLLFEELARDLERHEGDYPDLAREFAGVAERLQRRRFLRAHFTDDRYRDGKREFELAVREGTPAWQVIDNGEERGLQIKKDLDLRFKPYGAGLIYCHIRLRTAPGFRMTVQEAEDPRHRTELVFDGERILLVFHEGDDDGTILREVAVGRDMRPMLLDIGLLVSENGVRSWIGSSSQRSRPALREKAPAELLLHLPEHAVIERIGIWPREP